MSTKHFFSLNDVMFQTYSAYDGSIHPPCFAIIIGIQLDENVSHKKKLSVFFYF